MKKNILIATLSLIPGLALAQVSYNFTAGEGFSNGTIDGQNGWNASSEPASFIVDTSGSGTLVMGPTSSQFPNAALFSALSGNNYSGVMDFTLNYGVGTSSVFSAVPVLPVIEFTQFTGGFERIVFNTMRQTGATTFNTSLSVTGLTNPGGNFGPGFNFSNIGLAVDGSNLFTDGDSDLLRLEFSAQLTGQTVGGGDEWDVSLTLSNLDAPAVLSTVSITFVDEDNVFGANPHAFRFVPTNMNQNSAQVRVDSINVAVPEPSAFALLAGILGLGWVMVRRRKSA